MILHIDTEVGTLNGEPLYSKASFEAICDLYMRVGWDQKMPYTYSWMGMPILQIPEDMIRLQEVIYRLKPDVIVETGVAHGGSMIYYASLCHLVGHGCVIGIEKGLRSREMIEQHSLGKYVSLIEGDSTDPRVVRAVRHLCRLQKVLVILDSNHSKAHVAKELELYSSLVSSGSYIIAADGNMCELAEVPRGERRWKWDNPKAAAEEFAVKHPEFVIEQPAWPFNESQLSRNVTYWPSAWLKRQERQCPP